MESICCAVSLVITSQLEEAGLKLPFSLEKNGGRNYTDRNSYLGLVAHARPQDRHLAKSVKLPSTLDVAHNLSLESVQSSSSPQGVGGIGPSRSIVTVGHATWGIFNCNHASMEHAMRHKYLETA